MRILLVNTLYPPSKIGGAERSVQLLAYGLAGAGHDVAVACLHDARSASVESDESVEVHRLPMRNRYWPYDTAPIRSAPEQLRWHVRDQFNRSATDDLAAVIASFRPDVINTNNLTGFSTEVWHVARAMSIPVVHTIRDYGLLCARTTLFRDGAQCVRRCASCWALTVRKRQNSALVDLVIGISAAVLQRHRDAGCFGGVPDDVVHNIAASETPAIAQPATGVPVFGFLGRVQVEKGIEVLLAASEKLGDRPHRIRVAGHGDEAYVRSLTGRYRDRPIEWLGHVDADGFYASIDTLVVAPVLAEPMGRTVVEAAIRGVSVIHSDAGGIPEVASLCAQRAQVATADASALAAALANVLDEPAVWRARHPVQPARLTPYSTDFVVGRHLEIFDKLLQTPC